MKTLTVTSATLDGSTLTIVGTVADTTHASPAQQTSIIKQSAGNTVWSRLFQLRSTIIICSRIISGTLTQVAVYLDGLSTIAIALEPTLSWVPRMSTIPAATSVVAGSNASFAVVQNAADELAATYKWYRATTLTGTYTEITGATTPNDGQTAYANYTTATLGITAAAIGMTGYYYKVRLTNGAGYTESTPVALTVTAS